MRMNSRLLLAVLLLSCGRTPDTKDSAKESAGGPPGALLDSLPSDVGVVAFVELLEFAEEAEGIPFLEKTRAKLGDGMTCLVEQGHDEPFMAIGMPFPLTAADFSIVLSVPPTEKCAKAIEELDRAEDLFVLQLVRPGHYRGASSLEKLDQWARSSLGGSPVVDLIRKSVRAGPIRLALHPAEGLVGNLLGGPTAEDQVESLTAGIQMNSTLSLHVDLVWKSNEAAAQGEQLVTSAERSMLEAFGYGDFFELVRETQESDRDGERVRIKIALDTSAWKAILRRRAVYSLNETPMGEAEITYIVLPAGVATSGGSLLSDSGLRLKVAESTMSSGFVGLATLPGTPHERVTEVMSMLVPLGRSIVVSSSAVPTLSIAGALTQVCESRKMSEACLSLGLILRDGIGVTANLKAGNERLEQACFKGNSRSCAELGQYDPDDRDSAIRYWTGRTGEETSLPAFRLARLYGSGATEEDRKTAARWCNVAAERGHVGAMNELGILYDAGRGVQKDEKLAIAWFEKAAETGGMTAMENLGVMYRDSTKLRNDSKAVHWFRRAAEKGSHKGEFALGELLAEGRGTRKDLKEAARLLLKAARGGYERADLPLARAYRDGLGIAQDYSEAAKWFRSAAERGESEAHLELGSMYLQGHGLAEDDVEAYAWLSLAGEGFLPDERKKRLKVLLADANARLSSDDKSKAESLFRRYKNEYGRADGGQIFGGVIGEVVEEADPK